MSLTKVSFSMVQNAWFDVTNYGAVGDDVADDTSAIQTAIDAASAAGGGVVFFPVPSVGYRITATLNLPVQVHLQGDIRYGTLIRVRSGSYPTGYAILANTTNGIDWVVPFPNLRMCTVQKLNFETDTTSLFCIGFNGSFEIKDCNFRFFAKSIVGGPQYNDLVLIDNCQFDHNITPLTYQIELGNTGDAVVISRCHFPNIGNSPNTPLRSIKTDGTPVNVRDFLGGDIYLQTSTAMSTLDRVGMDGGSIILADSNVTINNAALSALQNDSVIRIANSSGFGFSIEINNSTISHDVFRGLYTPHQYDLSVGLGVNLTFNNVYKRAINSSDPKARNLLGVQIKSNTGTPIAAFNKYSYMYSTRCVLQNQQTSSNPFFLATPDTALNLLGPAFSFASADWEIASGTYYYKAVQYYDTGRAVARNDSNAEVNQAATLGGNAIGLVATSGAYPPCKIVRIYRGTSAGSYDAYADIPVVNTPSLVDVGSHISGVPWIARSAGPVDAFNNYTIGGFGIQEGRAMFVASAEPVSGTWEQADVVKNRTPAAGGIPGWVCTTAGTPGTWKAMANLAA
jgi:hypothetical protein